jgi:nucleoporin NDC1
MLFISSLSIFVLRVGQLHIGSRTAKSSLGTFQYLFPLQIAQTFGWYIFSAWIFTEIYLWSSPASAELEMVKRGR